VAQDAVPVSRQVRAAPRAVVTLVVAAALIVAADVITKNLAAAHLAQRPPIRLLGGAVYLTLTRNSGAAFSFGTGLTFVFPLVAIVVIGWICWLAWRLRSVPWAIALGLVLGGAMGNLNDRIFRAPGFMVGHVVDMVSLFAPQGERFAIFNVADSALCTGVALAILLELTGRRRDGTRLRREKSDEAEHAGKAEQADEAEHAGN
jgi:signal peptidase II